MNTRHSYACNLPAGLMQRKLEVLRDAITASFGAAPAVYKAGRYGVGPETVPALQALGFAADTSVVPHSDMSGDGGPDFRAMPDRLFLAADDVAEVPLSVHFVGRGARLGPRVFPFLERMRRWHFPGIAARLGVLERMRLSPEGHSFDDMRRQTEAALARGDRYLVLTYHSSSLMTGGSPFSQTISARDRVVRSLTHYIRYFAGIPRYATTTVSRLATRMRSGFQP